MKATIQRFYFLKLCILLYYAWDYFQNPPMGDAVWLWPVSWLQILSEPLFGIVCATAIGIALSFLSVFRPFNVVLKMGEMIFFFLFMAINYSFGKIDHAVHGIILVSPFLSLISNSNQRGDILLRSSVGMFLFTYFLSGLWKLRFAIEAILETGSIGPLKGALSYQLAMNIGNGGESTVLGMKLMRLDGLWQLSMWIIVIVFELMCGAVMFKPSAYRVSGILLIIFHQIIYFTMGIYFIEAQLLALVLLVLGPYGNRLMFKA